MKLHDQVKQQQEIINIYDEWVNDLLSYMLSPKFHGIINSYVNPEDITHRIDELKQHLINK